jgi:RNA polymerase sigma factor (sigma-70 family)
MSGCGDKGDVEHGVPASDDGRVIFLIPLPLSAQLVGLSSSPVEDRVLALRLCSGDDSALTEVFDRHGPLVLGLARRVTGSQAMAEDALQEVFATLWCDPSRFDPRRGSLRTYLGLLTHRIAVDMVRSTVRRQSREERSIGDRQTTLDSTEEVAIATVVRQAIDGLPSGQRQAVELTFWRGMTNHEVAQALGIAEGTVKSRLRLAGVKLRSSLGPLSMEPA